MKGKAPRAQLAAQHRVKAKLARLLRVKLLVQQILVLLQAVRRLPAVHRAVRLVPAAEGQQAQLQVRPRHRQQPVRNRRSRVRHQR